MTVPLCVEDGLEFGQGFGGGVGARAFVGGKDSFCDSWFASFVAGDGGGDGDGDQLVGEAAFSLRGEGFVVAGEGEGVLVFAGDVVMAGDALGGEAHGEQRGGVVLGEPGIGAGLGATHGDEAHGFSPAGDDGADAAGADAEIGEGDGFKAGGAEAIDGDAGDFNGQAGAEGGHAGDVVALLAFGLGAAEDDVVDFRFRSRAGTRWRAPVMARAARSSGRVVESAPLGARPTGVRTALTRTASGMGLAPPSKIDASRIDADFQGAPDHAGSIRSRHESPGAIGIVMVVGRVLDDRIGHGIMTEKRRTRDPCPPGHREPAEARRRRCPS